MYKLQVHLLPGVNPHHPEGGWHTTGSYETSELAEKIKTHGEKNNPTVEYRIIEVQEDPQQIGLYDDFEGVKW